MRYAFLFLFSILTLTSSGQNYGKYKVSTNLIRPFMEFQGYPSHFGWLSFSFLSSSRDVSIEPEVQLSDHFSVAVPVYVGISRMDMNSYDGHLYASYNYIDSVTVPPLTYIQTNYQRSIDLIGQVGMQGKWFPWGHEVRAETHVYPFASIGIITALCDIYEMDFGQTWNTEKLHDIGPAGYTSGQSASVLAIRSHKTMVLRGEFLLGIELMFGEHVGLTYSLGYSTKRNYLNPATDRLYSRWEGEAYEHIGNAGFPGEDNLYAENHKIGIHRLQLTIAFGKKTMRHPVWG